MPDDNHLPLPRDAYAEFVEFQARTDLSEREAAALTVRLAREAGVPLRSGPAAGGARSDSAL